MYSELCGPRISVLDRPLIEREWKRVRAFAQRLEPRDINLRFGRAIDLSDEPTLRRAFGVRAGTGEIAWMLDHTGAILGVSHRLIASPGEAEIALLVRSDRKRLGIGESLLRLMLARSAAAGLNILSAWVYRENRPVLSLARKFGYGVRGGSQWEVEIVFDVGSRRAQVMG
jgi:GNAT superfamily N-acetyltransferase